MKIPTVEQQFRRYLKLTGLSPRKMPKVQLSQTRRAFYGAAASMIVALMDMAALPDDDAIKELEKLRKETERFWNTETNHPNHN